MRLYIILILLICFSTIKAQKWSYEIDGSIDSSYNNEYVFLFLFGGDTISSVDSVMVKNGKFKFIGNEYVDNMSLLKTCASSGRMKSCDIVLERGMISVKFDSISKVTGTPLNNLYQAYQDTVRIMDNVVIAEYTKNVEGFEEPNDATFRKLITERMLYRRQFKLQNIHNVVGETTFIREVGREYDPLYLEILDTLPDKIKFSPRVKKYTAFFNQMLKQSKLLNNKFADYNLLSLRDKEQKISDYVGKCKYLYVDFWASWCAPCVAGIPLLKELYNRYQKCGLEIIAISIDKKKDDWHSACERLEMPWTNLVDLSGGAKLMELYEFKAIPYGVLIDDKGIVVGEKLDSSLLARKLKELFPNF